ncbi:KH y domain-containing protein 4 [Bulinus truncatus]|nr:KH y domain-containing protein 4 [Bulinus truncatus]
MLSQQDQEDKSSLEAAAEAAAKVNAMLISKGMLKPNQIQSATNVITKKAGGPNSLVVAEVEINNLTTACRNTLTRGSTQEEISKASGAAVTTRGRYMAPDEKARNPRDRCLYLNVQATTKESVDIAVQKINEIIGSMSGNKVESKNRGTNQLRGGRMRTPFRPNINNRFNFRNQPPPPLMSLPTPPPPPVQMAPPPPPQTVTVFQENLYIGLEHAPPNFDTKNKLLGPGGSYLLHIQTETGAAVSLRGKGSGFANMTGLESIEPMHVHLEHHSLLALQEAKKLAENLIQTVQQSYVSFQQALAALPPSIPTGLITGVPQQPAYVEAQLGPPHPNLSAMSITEHTLQAMQPQVQQLGPTMLMPPGSVASQLSQITQGLTNNSGQGLMLPTNINLSSVSMMNGIPVSAASMLSQQTAHIDLGGQQQMILSQPPPGPPQALAQVGLQQIVSGAPPGQQPLPSHYGHYNPVQPTVHLVSQPVSIPSHTIVQQPGPPQHMFAPQPGQQISISAPTSLVYTMASTNPPPYYTSPKLEEEPKRRFTEEKDEKIPDNLLGYQHGPPHLVNLVQSSPPPHSIHPPISQGMVPPPGTQIIQSQHGLIHVSHLTPDQGQFTQIGTQAIIHSAPQLFQATQEGQQLIGHSASHQFHTGLPPPHFISGPPAPPMSPSQHLAARSPGFDSGLALAGAPSPATLSNLNDGRKEELHRPNSSDLPWDSGSRRRAVSPTSTEPDKKKMKGILKNKHNSSQQHTEGSEIKSDSERVVEDKHHPASPQYQGQPLRYPCLPSDSNLSPISLESRVSHQLRTLASHLPPGHHLMHQADPNLPPQVQIAHPHMHIENSRPEVAPSQIVIEHPGVQGTPIHITHRVGASGQIHIEHALAPPRQILYDHSGQQAMQLEHQPGTLAGPPSGHPDHVHAHIPVSHQQPPTQEMYEFDLSAQQLQPPPAQFHQTFEHISVSQSSQVGEHMLAPSSAVIVSSTQHFPQYSVALTSSAPPAVSYSLPTSTPFAIQSQGLPQQIQRLPEPQQISVPPPPSSYTVGLNPAASPHFQTHFTGLHPGQTLPAHLFHQTQQPPPPLQASQPQFQTHPQSISYWNQYFKIILSSLLNVGKRKYFDHLLSLHSFCFYMFCKYSFEKKI